MNTNGDGFAFIIGHRKSGSTWLLNLMSLHPDIRGLMETHLFHLGWAEPDPVRRTDRLFSQTPWSEGGTKNLLKHHLMNLAAPVLKRSKPALSLKKEERPATLPDLGLFDQAALRRELRRTPPPEEYVHRFFHFQKDRLRPRRYLLEKSPRNVNRVETIREIFPKSKLIVIYRDGRDVVTSDKFFTRDYGGRAFDFAEATRDWRSDMEAHLKHVERHPVFACSYEKLLGDGAAVARELFQFLDLPHDDRLIHDLLERSSFRFYAGREPGQEDRKRFYRKGVAGDWKNHFSDEDKQVFKDAAGDMLVRLGYEKDLSW
ncbi:MAG TPA: sulfotransferase [Thermoanaerobaculia bacterium]|nr:sulfotransferase [Thermoanaerobaculia bacterium]